MAGTIQALVVTGFPAPASAFRHRNSDLLSIDVKFRDISLSFSSLTCNVRRSRFLPAIVRACQPSGQIDGNGSNPTNLSALTKGLSWAQPILSFAGNNFLPLALISGVTLGLAYPSLGCLADKYSVSKLGPFGIFIISGLMLRSKEIGAAVEAWPVGLFGLVSILFLTPNFSRAILQIQLQPQEFITGLAVFSCMPTTLSSGVALTQLAGGNSALALAMTVISNLLGIFIVPFSITKFVADGVGVTVPTDHLFKSLLLTILVPLILGKVVRESFKGVADFVDQNRKLFSGINAFFLSLVPWIQVSRSRSLLLMVKPRVFVVAIGLGTLLHLSLLLFNIIAVRSISAITGGIESVFSREENAIAFILVASQKTLPVMVAVIEPLRGALGESGLLVLPCVAAHLNQIIMDSFLINFPRSKGNSNSIKEAKQ
ncbi:probable sodium/metabolite cotransporter BASS4, chloroplastic isoform X2 [Prosopis cineraria]|uniref:probable sodium/metabolite cotransporter BASS4, chloroplastic isoform X2 n=1 Tax=Prosopis cineraria TaxID=364024 RepID=UPI00240FC3EF|nr:probable sodium/metabolite cotransporter BASS4, chloroplastic isoform X2 [Prosopis cineraria]